MPHFIRNRTGKVLSTTLAPRSRRSSSGNIQSLWVGVTYLTASGGTTNTYVSSGITYQSHEFTSSGSFVVSTLGTDNSADILVVGGGGGGGNDRGGGAGAGGFRQSTQTLTATTYTVTIGANGIGGTYGTVVCTGGGNSSISGSGLTTILGTGGGRGADLVGGYHAPGSGGSGGGGNPGNGTGGSGNAGGFSPVEGYKGGNSSDGWMGAGGGGASGVGTDNSYGAGGAAASNAYKTGTNISYANGGAGMPTTGNSGNYGAGGGGGTAGTAGVVVIRYRIG